MRVVILGIIANLVGNYNLSPLGVPLEESACALRNVYYNG